MKSSLRCVTRNLSESVSKAQSDPFFRSFRRILSERSLAVSLKAIRKFMTRKLSRNSQIAFETSERCDCCEKGAFAQKLLASRNFPFINDIEKHEGEEQFENKIPTRVISLSRRETRRWSLNFCAQRCVVTCACKKILFVEE